MASVLDRFENLVLKELRDLEIGHQLILVAVSGGVDSMALVETLRHLSRLLQLEVCVAHIHHGSLVGPQGDFRNRAWRFVKGYCKKHELRFYSNCLEIWPETRFHTAPSKPLKSEADLREFRYERLNDFSQQLSVERGRQVPILLAHNADDLLETRLMRLIRGSGGEGLEGMSSKENNLVRPFLNFERTTLKSYLEERRIDYVDDPSNEDLEPFRNWMRHDWLPQLETKRPGALGSFSRSLRHLMEERIAESWNPEEFVKNQAIDGQRFLELSKSQKKRLLAYYMRLLQMKNYGLSHIEEVLKRLDSPEKEHKFTLLKHNWTVNAEQIIARPI